MSLANAALQTLKSRLVTVDDNGMFNSYDHIMVCHGCGAFHAVRSAFISPSLAIGFRFSDGEILSIPCYKCPACPGQAIRDAWEKGIRRSVINKAAQEIGAEVPPDPLPCRLCGTIVPTRGLDAHELCVALSERRLPTPPLPEPRGYRP